MVALLPVFGGYALASAQAVTVGDEDRAIAALMLAYQDDLDASNAAASVALYADDAVLMTPNHPTLVGRTAIGRAYAAGAAAIAFNIRFHIDEIVHMAPDWAFVRTGSGGSSTMKASGLTKRERNQELFILHRDGPTNWKISRYSFSSTLPPT